jgi:hypothetical protein
MDIGDFIFVGFAIIIGFYVQNIEIILKEILKELRK